jgi:hypothetical protein
VFVPVEIGSVVIIVRETWEVVVSCQAAKSIVGQEVVFSGQAVAEEV